MAGEISFSGLSSGIDTASIVQQLVAVERTPINLLESKKSDLESQRSKLQGISTKIQALETAATALSEMDELAFYTGSSSDDAVAGVTIGGQTRAGRYQLEVTALAKEDRNYSASFAAGAIGLADGDTLELTIDGELPTVTCQATDTLEDVADRINAAGSASWATVVGDGEGGGRLLIASKETGLAQQLTFGGTAAATFGMTNIQAASDASIVIDGMVTATSSTNTFEDVIEGLIFEAEGLGTATVTVTDDTEQLQEKVKGFVTAYNNVITAINAEFAWTGEARTSANLSGDVTLRSIQQTLRDAVSGVVSGLAGDYTSLSSIGITSDRSGTLTIDETKLDEALADDSQAVKNLFAENRETGTSGLAYRMVNAMDGAELSLIESIIDNDVGSLSARVDGIDERTTQIDESIERMEIRLESYEKRLRGQFTAMEQMMASLQSQSGYLTSLSSSLGGR